MTKATRNKSGPIEGKGSDQGSSPASLTQTEKAQVAKVRPILSTEGSATDGEEILDNSLELEEEDNAILNEVWAELRQEYAANPEKFLEEWDEDLDGIEPI